MAKKKTIKVASEEAVKEEIAKEVVAETAETPASEITEEAPAPKVQEKPKRTRKKATAKPVTKEAEKSAAGFDVQGAAWLYSTSVVPKAIKTITGKVYAWGEENSGRVPVTDDPDGAGKLNKLLGWVDKGDLK